MRFFAARDTDVGGLVSGGTHSEPVLLKTSELQAWTGMEKTDVSLRLSPCPGVSSGLAAAGTRSGHPAARPAEQRVLHQGQHQVFSVVPSVAWSQSPQQLGETFFEGLLSYNSSAINAPALTQCPYNTYFNQLFRLESAHWGVCSRRVRCHFLCVVLLLLLLLSWETFVSPLTSCVHLCFSGTLMCI